MVKAALERNKKRTFKKPQNKCLSGKSDDKTGSVDHDQPHRFRDLRSNRTDADNDHVPMCPEHDEYHSRKVN